MNNEDDRQDSAQKPERVVRSEPTKQTKRIDSRLLTGQVVITRDNALIIKPSLFEVVFDEIYRFLYMLGLAVMRALHRYQRRASKVIHWLKEAAINGLRAVVRWVFFSLRDIWRHIKSPFTGIRTSWKEEQFNMQVSRENGKFPWPSFGRILKSGLLHSWNIVSTVLNYVAPVVAVVLLLSIVSAQLETEYVLHVTYRDRNLGYIRNEQEFSAALKEVDGRLAKDVDSHLTADVPYFNLVRRTSGIELVRQEDLVDGIIRASSADVVKAFGLYANQQLVGAVVNQTPIINELSRLEDENTSGKPGEREERMEFEKAIAFREGLYPSETIITEDQLIEIINSTETSDEIYTTSGEDTLESVATKMGIALQTIIDLNPTVEAEPDETLEEGGKLFITKARRFLSIKTIYTDVEDVPIDFTTIETPNPIYAPGYRGITKPGILGVAKETVEIMVVDGVPIDRKVISREVISEPISEQVTVGVAVHPDKNEKGFGWPSAKGYIGTGVGGYPGHVGIDIIGTGGVGAPVYASASGVVTTATWSYAGYGNYVVISHSDGYETLYAHNSILHVNVGDRVAKGQVIAAVGSTGNSTGPHIHLEIKQNGQILNPANFVSPN